MAAGVAPRSLAEAVTASFVAWETRGRGWTLADYPVSLEPPHRPFFILPEYLAAPAEDDGRRHTVLSAAIERLRTLFADDAPAAEPPEAYVEDPPFPAAERGELVAISLGVPPDFAAERERASALLLALAGAAYPVAFEMIGAGGTVALQFVCTEDDAGAVRAALGAYASEAVALEGSDALAVSWSRHAPRAVVDFGLAHECFLPLNAPKSLGLDPLIPLVNALAGAAEDEIACLQVLFERARNPWPRTIREALVDRRGKPLFADAPEFLPLAREKTRSPILAVLLRLGVCAADEARLLARAKAVAAALEHFARPDGNAFMPLANDGYDDDLHEEAFLARESFRTGMLLSVDELVGLVHLPDASLATPALLRLERHTKALPEIAKGHRLVLGDNVHHGVVTPATVPTAARLAHTHVIGASGTGKSTLLLNLIAQDIAAGDGVAVIDPHGDLVDAVLARIPSQRTRAVVVFDPADTEWPIGFNMLQAKTDAERALLASDLVAVFRRLATSWGDAMNTVLANAVVVLLESRSGGTLVDLRHFLVEEGVRQKYVSEIDDPHTRYFWEKEYGLIGARSIGPILTRLDAFLRPRAVRHIVGQKDGKLDIGAVVEGRKVLLAKLAQGLIGEENARLLGSLLVSKIHQVALARQALAARERTPFWVYVDECQHFVTPSMASLLSEARKYGVGLTLAHQTLAQLKASPEVESALLGNAYTRIVFRTGPEDARRLAEEFRSFDADDLTRLLTAEAIVCLGSAEHDFNLRVRPAAPPDANAADTAAVIAASREQFATPVAAVLDALRLPREEPVKPERRSTPAREPSIARGEPETAAESSATSVCTPVPPSRPRVAPSVTKPPLPDLGRGGREHKYLQHLVKRLAEERGFHASIEDPAGDGRSVDVVLRKDQLAVGCEIAVTTDVEHELANLRKCLAQDFARIFVISPDKRRREGIARRLGEIRAATPVDVLSPEDVVVALDELAASTASTETTVRGYKVKVNRQQLSPAELAGKRATIAEVIARAMRQSTE